LQQAQNDPTYNDYGADNYRRISEAFRSVIAKLHEADQLKVQLEVQLGKAAAVFAKAPGDVADSARVVTESGNAIKAISDKGFKVPQAATSRLAEAVTILANARTQLEAKAYAAAVATAKTGAEGAKAALKSAEEVPAFSSEIAEAITALTDRSAVVEKAVAAAEPVLADIMKTYAPASWSSVKDNLTMAPGSILAARKAITQASDAASLDKQDWMNARASLGDARVSLDRADALHKAVTSLRWSLETAKRDAAGQVTTARSKIAAATAFLTEKKADLATDFKPGLAAATQKADAAETELTQATPEYLGASANAQAASAAAEDVQKKAMAEVAILDGKRKRLKDALEETGKVLSEAEVYVKRNMADVASTRMQEISAARIKLSCVSTTAKLDDKIVVADTAKRLADTVLAAAKADVKRAEDERAAARERARLEAERLAREAAARLAEQRRQEAFEEERREAAVRAEAAASYRETYSPPVIIPVPVSYDPPSSYDPGPSYAPSTPPYDPPSSPSYDSPSSGGGGGDYSVDTSSSGGGGDTSVDTSSSGGGGESDI
jgi:hypothetical protein